jgi:hemerythrin-like domain-containing protein
MLTTQAARLISPNGESWEDAMVEIIEILRQEHRNIEKLLRVMEQELNVFDRGERPDYEVFGAVIEFFKKYPDSCHHPKEDIIYRKFKARDPGRAASIADLEAEHREGAVRLRRVAQAIESVLNDQELLRENVDRIVRDFIDNERKHIALEDEVIFPAIAETLQPGDWADIALTLADRYGPPSQADFEEQFSTLRRNILELEEAAVARRL